MTAATTGEAAGRPSRPARDLAVNGASVIVAAALLGEHGASVTTVFGVSDDAAATSLATATTGEAASGP